MNDVKIKIHKMFVFPWGLVSFSVAWFTIYKALISIFDSIPFVSYQFFKPLFFFAGELLIVTIILVASFHFEKGKTNNHNIYILFSSERIEDDKLITKDFAESFKTNSKKRIPSSLVIVPASYKRETFTRQVNKSKYFWKSKRWQHLHKRLKGVLYFSGELVSRNSLGKPHYILHLTATVGYDKRNIELEKYLSREISKNVPSVVLIRKDYEFEDFNELSNKLSLASENLIAWSALVSGQIEIALRMHYDLYLNKNSIKEKSLSESVYTALKIELLTIMNQQISLTNDSFDMLKQLLLSIENDNEILISASRFFVRSCRNSKSFNLNVDMAWQTIQKVRINKECRSVVSFNKAYLSLLKGKYKEAEKYYDTAFKHSDSKTIDMVLEYCEEVINDGLSLEKPTAFFVKALVFSRVARLSNEKESVINQALETIPLECDYYISTLKGIKA